MFWYGSMGRFLSAGFILDRGCSEEDFIPSPTSSWSRSDVKILKRQQPLLARLDSGGWWLYKQAMAGSLSGIIICDALRRIVARNLVQQYATTIHTACAPHQFALSTRAGTVAVVRTISVASQSNPQHTVLSADGIGAYATISRNSMQQGLRSNLAPPNWEPHHHPRGRRGTRRPIDASVVFFRPAGGPPSHPAPASPR